MDAERDFIAGNLADIRLVVHQEYLRCVAPVFRGPTATGGTYDSDGRMLVLDLHAVESGNLDLRLDTANLKGNNGGGAVLINASR